MIGRSQTNKSAPLNVVGSSVFGRYPKISLEKTYNMFESDGWMVPYAGYKSVIPASTFGNAAKGRGIFTSTKLNRLVTVYDNRVYLINISFNQTTQNVDLSSVVQVGTLATSSGPVYITENLKPQVVISDNVNIYYYDPTLTPSFQIAYQDTMTPPTPINFKPGFIDYHDTYILGAATNDMISDPPSSNTWRLGVTAGGPAADTIKLIFPDDASHVGLLQSKSDNTQAAVRMPGRGNLISVLGNIVTESWFDQGLALFPYQRSSSYSTDYGCLNPDTIAAVDTIVCWLAQNEKTGPIITYSTGSEFEKITTDGIDYLFSNFTDPSDSRAFMYRQDGHLFYHINFYTDNTSLFYDFNTKKFYHASDENGNYFIADQVAFFNNQYYFVTRNNGNLYAFDTIYTTYDGKEIPRIRICKPVRLESQEYFIGNDAGFTIEQGETPFQQQTDGAINIITQDGKQLITQAPEAEFMISQDGNFILTQDGQNIVFQGPLDMTFFYLIMQNPVITYVVPRVDLSISIDGGEMFSSNQPYYLNPLGRRKNKLLWWRLGAANDMTCRFEFWGMGRFVAYNGILNVRQ